MFRNGSDGLENRGWTGRGAKSFALALALAGGMTAYGLNWNGGQANLQQARASTEQDAAAVPFQGSFAALAERLSPSVVNIKATKVQKTASPWDALPEGPFRDRLRPFFEDKDRIPGGRPMEGAGSGVVVSTDGLILTNNHVVEGANQLAVTFADQEEVKAEIVGRDPRTDLAVLRVKSGRELAAARLGDSDALKVGDWVLAIGNPFGLSHTLTSGVVSAKGRVLGAGPYDDFIQTDASINPGNSGGPLFNMRGEVVGINTAILPSAQGIGFAIPVNLAKQLMPQLVEHGEVTRGYIGVQIQKVTPELAKAMNLEKPEGALVTEVISGGPAEQAGIQRGDVIVSFDGKAVHSSQQLPSIVAGTAVGGDVPVRVLRAGREKELRVRVQKLASKELRAETTDEAAPSRWGMELQELSPELARRRGLEENGVLVADVKPGSPADKASLQRGDVILEVNRKRVDSIRALKSALTEPTDKGSHLLLVQRDGNKLFVALAG